LEIDGRGAYGMLKHEAGVHRVQRVPATESQGRVHTSTAAVVVRPLHCRSLVLYVLTHSYRFYRHHHLAMMLLWKMCWTKRMSR
jgi:hypothetical protein